MKCVKESRPPVYIYTVSGSTALTKYTSSAPAAPLWQALAGSGVWPVEWRPGPSEAVDRLAREAQTTEPCSSMRSFARARRLQCLQSGPHTCAPAAGRSEHAHNRSSCGTHVSGMPALACKQRSYCRISSLHRCLRLFTRFEHFAAHAVSSAFRSAQTTCQLLGFVSTQSE